MIIAPYFWEDGYTFQQKFMDDDIIDWETKGLKIFDFHPLDIYLNTTSKVQRDNFKNQISI